MRSQNQAVDQSGGGQCTRQVFRQLGLILKPTAAKITPVRGRVEGADKNQVQREVNRNFKLTDHQHFFSVVSSSKTFWSLRMVCLVARCVVLAMAVVGALAWGEKDRVRLEEVQVLTLVRGAMTTGRRSSPVPQLTCVGGTGRHEEQPDRVQCYNRGSDGRGVQWECKADMDGGLRFGAIEVVCEGYDHPDDPTILAGSCGLEYTLDLTKEGQVTELYRLVWCELKVTTSTMS